MLKNKDIKALVPTTKTYNKSCGTGNGLIIEVSSIKQGGTKCFVGRTRFRKKQTTVYIGSFGNGYGKLSTVPEANREWEKRLIWASQNGRSPKDYGKKEISETKTLKHAIKGFLKQKSHEIKATSLKEYDNKFNNQILTKIDGETPLKHLEWDGELGRQEIMRVVEAIKDGGKGNNIDLSRRCQDILKGAFNYAIAQGWMSRGQNPATRPEGEKNPHKQSHHKTISFEDVPKFLKEVNLNRHNAHPISVLSTKFLLLTFLRAGASTRLEWSWIKEINGIRCIEIDGNTSGLKRKKGVNDHIPHHIPITENLEKLLDQIAEYSEGEKYIFTPIRQSRFSHLDPSTPNNYLRNIGYQNVLVAHGWRSTALTAGQEILGEDSEIIQRQMGHLLGDKVRKAYDKSIMLERRKKFLENWGNLLIQNGLKI